MFTVTGSDGTNTDTFTQIGSNQSRTYECQALFVSFGVHGSAGGYSIHIDSTHGCAGSSSCGEGGFGISILQFSGTLSTVAFNCGGVTNTCSASMTPSTSPAVIVGGISDYYNDTFASGTYTVPSGAAYGGSFIYGTSEYIVCASGCGTAHTPAFTVTGTNYTLMTGAVLQ